jgi:hypothetical protein
MRVERVGMINMLVVAEVAVQFGLEKYVVWFGSVNPRLVDHYCNLRDSNPRPLSQSKLLPNTHLKYRL